jgi:hypothetical protein
VNFHLIPLILFPQVFHFGGLDVSAIGIPLVHGVIARTDVIVKVMVFDGAASIVPAPLAERSRPDDVDTMPGARMWGSIAIEEFSVTSE